MAKGQWLLQEQSPRHGGGPNLCLAWLLFGGCGPGLFVLAAEALDAASSIHQLLFSGEKRMAVGADFKAYIALAGGAGGECVAARAVNAHFFVCGMNGFLHGFLNLSWKRLF